VSEDVLKTYEFYVKIAEEDVRDGDATAWEGVVAAFAAALRAAGVEWQNMKVMIAAEQKRVEGLAAALRVERERAAELESHINATDPWRDTDEKAQ